MTSPLPGSHFLLHSCLCCSSSKIAGTGISRPVPASEVSSSTSPILQDAIHILTVRSLESMSIHSIPGSELSVAVDNGGKGVCLLSLLVNLPSQRHLQHHCRKQIVGLDGPLAGRRSSLSCYGYLHSCTLAQISEMGNFPCISQMI